MTEIIGMLIELMYSFVSLAWSVLPMIGLWHVFEKAGEKGWKAIIPFYNMYIMLKLGDKKKYWGLYLTGTIIYLVTGMFLILYVAWLMMALIFAFGAVDFGWSILEQLGPIAAVCALVLIAGYVLMWIATIHGYAGICKKMNQGTGMVVGLIFLGPIFWMLLGCSKEYQWQQDVTTYTPPEYDEWNTPYQQ